MSSFDRRLRVTVSAPEEDGGAVTFDRTLWAVKRDLGSAVDITDAGVSTEAFDTFTVRYNAAIANAPADLIDLYYRDDPGHDARRYYVRRVREIGRRKYLEFDAAFTSRAG